MIEISGDLWDYHDTGNWIVISTNCIVTNDGRAVMGRGVAFQCAQRYRAFPYLLGDHIRKYGNRIGIFEQYRIIAFPVKNHFREMANLDLIRQSTKELADIYYNYQGEDDELELVGTIYLPRVGCGSGRLDWSVVKPILEEYLTSDDFVVVYNET